MYGPTLTFRDWMGTLQADCHRKNKLIVFESLGQTTLELLWEGGTEPSTEGISNIRREQRGKVATMGEQYTYKGTLLRDLILLVNRANHQPITSGWLSAIRWRLGWVRWHRSGDSDQ